MKAHDLKPLALALAVSGLLGACSLTPEYKRPEAPVASSYPAASAAAGSSQQAAAPDIEWKNFFSDARLRQLISLALVNNRDLRVAVLNIEQARAQFQIRRADQFPTLNFGGTATRQPVSVAPGKVVMANTYTVGLSVTAWNSISSTAWAASSRPRWRNT